MSALLIPLLGLTQDLMGSGFGEALRPAIVAFTGMEKGLIPNLLAATVIAALFAGNLFLLALMRFRYQTIVVWGELIILFALFFASFDLSYVFIGKKLYQLVVVGAAMTIFISLA